MLDPLVRRSNQRGRARRAGQAVARRFAPQGPESVPCELVSAVTTVRQERRPPEREVSEVAPGVLRIQLPMDMPGLGHVNCYAIEDREGVALIDPGTPNLSSWRVL